MTKLRAKQKTPDYQQQQVQREREIMLGRRQSACDVIEMYGRDNGWTPAEVTQVVAMLGLDVEPGLIGGNGWTGFNNG